MENKVEWVARKTLGCIHLIILDRTFKDVSFRRGDGSALINRPVGSYAHSRVTDKPEVSSPLSDYFSIACHSGRMDLRFQSSGTPYGAAVATPDIMATAHRVRSYQNEAFGPSSS